MWGLGFRFEPMEKADGRRQEPQHAVTEEGGTTTRGRPLRGAPDILCGFVSGPREAQAPRSRGSESLSGCAVIEFPRHKRSPPPLAVPVEELSKEPDEWRHYPSTDIHAVTVVAAVLVWSDGNDVIPPADQRAITGIADGESVRRSRHGDHDGLRAKRNNPEETQRRHVFAFGPRVGKCVRSDWNKSDHRCRDELEQPRGFHMSDSLVEAARENCVDIDDHDVRVLVRPLGHRHRGHDADERSRQQRDRRRILVGDQHHGETAGHVMCRY